MTYSECVAALHSMTVGRACVVTEDGPFLLPVQYTVLNEQIFFRAHSATVVATHADNRPLAFEVDEFLPGQLVGWSVLARGLGHAIDHARATELSGSLGRPKPWAGGPGLRLFSIAWTQLTGRRMEEWPYTTPPAEGPPATTRDE